MNVLERGLKPSLTASCSFSIITVRKMNVLERGLKLAVSTYRSHFNAGLVRKMNVLERGLKRAYARAMK